MSDNVTILGMDDDDDKTVFLTEEDRKKLEKEILGLGDDDTTEVGVTHQVTSPNQPCWQQFFG